MRGRRLLGGALLAAGLALAAGAPLAWTLTRPPSDAGALPPASPGAGPVVPAPPAAGLNEPATAAPGAAATDARPAAPTPGPATGRPRPVTRSAGIEGLARPQAAEPAGLRIPQLGIDAPIVAVGVADDGAMAVPTDVRDVGWYRHGPVPGEHGSAVLAAHVDSRAQGRGVFFELRRLDLGAEVVVTDDRGDDQRFVVVARRTYDKGALPTDELFRRAGPPRLVLVTCGGGFDRTAGTYRANVVVHAVPTAEGAER